MIYGLLDTKDKVWIGNDDGPITFDHLGHARLAAEIRAYKLGWKLTRIRAVPYNPPPMLVKRDDVKCVKTDKDVEKYLDRREKGLL